MTTFVTQNTGCDGVQNMQNHWTVALVSMLDTHGGQETYMPFSGAKTIGERQMDLGCEVYDGMQKQRAVS